MRFNKLRKPQKDRNGYLQVLLSKNGKVKMLSVHRLVLLTFIGECPEGYECDHINRIRTDNRLENLRWATRSENQFNRNKFNRTFKLITAGTISKTKCGWRWHYRHNGKRKSKRMKNKEDLLKYRDEVIKEINIIFS